MSAELSDINRTLEGTNGLLVNINESLKELTEEIKKVRMLIEKRETK